MLDSSILVLRRWINPAELPDEMAISVTRPALPQEKDANRRE